jgi:signal transduction histidine kinase
MATQATWASEVSRVNHNASFEIEDATSTGAQASGGAIHGTGSDPSGAAVPEASIRIETVASQAATVDLAASQTGAVNRGEVVRELPLNGRDWTTLAALQPEVSIVRTWWSTRWFKLACAFVAGLMAWLSWRLRTRQMAQGLNLRFEERLRERTRIARELHDTLLQSFHGLLFQFQAVDNLLPTRPGEAKQILESALDNAAQAIREARDAVHGLRSSTVVTNDLAAAVTAWVRNS